MPTYEYRCERGHEFERFQKMSDDPISTCPECGGEAERLLSGGGGFVFRGEGFYATDYRSSEYRKKEEKEAGGGESEASSSGTPEGEAGGSGTDAADAGSDDG